MAMWTEGRNCAVVAISIAAALLLWPALWNGYPLVFSDTGTYLSQAIEHYAGWDRPIFYSLFLLPLHMTLTTWPVVVAQALLVAHLLHLLRRTMLPETSSWWLLPVASALTIGTALPWFTSQLMPDLFTGLLVIALALLILVPQRLTRLERNWLVIVAAFTIAAHQSHILLALALTLVLVPLRRRLGDMTGAARLLPLAPLALAIIALVSANTIAFGRVSLSPFGNVFLLARVIYDGPGMDVLRHDCPDAGWRLCAFVDQFPPTSDEFLWQADGPLAHAGGAEQVSPEADAIIAAALRAEPFTQLQAFLRNMVQQLRSFTTGDGLQPWPTTVTPWIQREFPRAEAAAYLSSLQTQGLLGVPVWLQAVHAVTALSGVALCCMFLFLPSRRQQAINGLAAATLLALVANAAITGGLSTPHDRYQSRIMWLPPVVAVLGAASLRSSVRSAPADETEPRR